MRPVAPTPHVVIIGGYLTEPLFYRPMRARILERGAARVTVAPLHLPDWIGAAFVGFGHLLMRGGRAIRGARRASDAPLIVVGHSAGGIVARLAMSPLAYDGRRMAVADDVGCLVTLGTPHLVRPHVAWRGNAGQRATRFLARAAPGASFAPVTGYLTVGSTAVPPRGADPAPPPKQLLNRLLTAFVGPSVDVGGDGIVTDDLCHLDGVRHITLPNALHGTYGGPWYGDGDVIDRWWPAALEEWRLALEARAARRTPVRSA
jgi:PGAP1-like protein